MGTFRSINMKANCVGVKSMNINQPVNPQVGMLFQMENDLSLL